MENAAYQVTAYCLAYNHEKYIRKTLEGFVSQKTDFPFKIIVHDDASTDGTAQIIREYAERYPNIIFPIYQTENQYSKGVRIYQEIILPQIDTPYVAICEGDDYWCDENKLQLQYDFMKSHPECSMCVHNTMLIDSQGEPLGRNINSEEQDRDISTNEIIAAGGGQLFHTSSFLYRKQYRMNMPHEYYIRGIGDYPLAIYFSTVGTVHYLGRVMSAYRVASKGSWSVQTYSNRQKNANHLRMIMDFLVRIDTLTEGKYHDGFSRALQRYEYFALSIEDKSWMFLFKRKLLPFFKENYPNKKTRVSIICKSAVKYILRALHLRK